MAEAAHKESVPSALEQTQGSAGAKGPVMESSVNQQSATSPNTVQDQELLSSAKPATETAADQKSRKYVLATGETLFQSLFAAEKTPPTSPGSVASSSTLMDPSSRKVSPSDSEIRAKGSPTAVKDFAYPSSDSDHVRDPTTIAEENTNKALLKQLKKRTAAEEKASRKAAKLAARTKSLSAELKSANANVRNRDAQVDLAKTIANAMTLSNVVLRQAIKDLGHDLTREKNGIQVQDTQSQEETTWDQQKEGTLQNHLGLAGDFGAGAYDRMAELENASVESNSPASASGTIRSEVEVEETEGRPEGEAKGFSEKYGIDPTALLGVVNSSTPTVQENTEEKHNAELSHAKEVLQQVKELVVDAVAPGTGQVSLQHNQQQDLETHEDSSADDETKEELAGSGNGPAGNTMDQVDGNVECNESALGQGQAVEDPITTSSKTTSPHQDDSSKSSGEAEVLEVDHDNSPLSVGGSIRGSDCDEGSVPQDPIFDEVMKEEYVQGVDGGRGDSISGRYEFPEAAGPATMWGILESNQGTDQAEEEAHAGEEAATVSGAAGPATMWGILRSDVAGSEVKDQEGAGDEVADVSDTEGPGPALLWGILESDCKPSAETSSDGDLREQAHGSSDAVLDEPEGSVATKIQEEDDELNVLALGEHPLAFDDDTDDLYNVSDNKEEIVEPLATTNGALAEDPLASPQESVCSDDARVQEVQEVDAHKVTKEGADAVIADTQEDAVEAIAELDGGLQGVTEGDPDVETDALEPVILHEGMIPYDTNTPIGVIEETTECLDDATVARKEEREEGQAAYEANASEGSEETILAQDEAVSRAETVQASMVEETQGPKDSEASAGPAVSNNLQATCEDYKSDEDHQVHNVPIDPTHPSTPATSPPTPEAEFFGFIPPMQQPKELTKGQKRNLERKRAAAKKKEEAALKRRMEEEAAKSPEALAQRQAEEDARLGEKRLRLQKARMLAWEKMEGLVQGL